jgi:methylase of polypeptide subunit release factors
MHWEPCETDPIRGVATFDGITITTDSIEDPRWDRVMPIFEEEQVFMCRQMRPLLKERLGALALDVGTGSGVFAIWAAKHGCRVIAIDITKRSLKIARKNAHGNGVTVFNSRDDLMQAQEPGIYFLLQRVEDFAEEEENHTKFDFVFLNPPHNPTCPGVLAAAHAEAGEDGQEAFKVQVKLVPKLLKEGGCCIGFQMSLARNGEIEALAEIAQAFKRKCHIQFMRVLNDKPADFPVKTFLQEQYAGYLNNNRRPSRQEVQDYIQRVAKENLDFALIYYQVRKEATPIQDGKPEPLENVARPPHRSWKDRIWLHKAIVENISSPTHAVSKPL